MTAEDDVLIAEYGDYMENARGGNITWKSQPKS